MRNNFGILKWNRAKTKLVDRYKRVVEVAADFRGGVADRYLDFVVLPLHYEIVVNVFRTRPRHLVKFQSSRSIVAVRADSGNYRPIKPPLRPPDPSILLRFRTPVLPQTDTLPSARRAALASRPPLFPASDVRQIARDRDTAPREKEKRVSWGKEDEKAGATV